MRVVRTKLARRQNNLRGLMYFITSTTEGRNGGAVGNMSSAVCSSSIYSRLSTKMSSFLSVRAWAMPRTSYLSHGIPFPV